MKELETSEHEQDYLPYKTCILSSYLKEKTFHKQKSNMGHLKTEPLDKMHEDRSLIQQNQFELTSLQ